jgi:uncharacterized OB-fold protein
MAPGRHDTDWSIVEKKSSGKIICLRCSVCGQTYNIPRKAYEECTQIPPDRHYG